MVSYQSKLSDHWMILSSAEEKHSGAEISVPGFPVKNWYYAEVPSTVLGTLVKNNVYRDLYVGTNMEKVPEEQFHVPWWYRTEFDLEPEQADKTVLISFDGINYKGDIWLNGKQVAGKEEVTGAFRRFRFDISAFVVPGKNILAVEVTPPGPGDFSTGFVDWNIDPPDRNMGIFREVTLHINGGVSIDHPFVQSQFNADHPDHASLTITTSLVNHEKKKITGVLKASIDSLKIEKEITLQPEENKSVVLDPEEYLELNIQHPQLWWPNNLGNPSLYKLELTFETEGNISDKNELAFGIRKVEDFFENGHRGFRINGHKVVIKGAGWTDDLLLMDTHESLEAQIAYVRHLNLNTIRMEGFWGKDQYLYDLCDRYGILMMVGWSCHWEHEKFLGKPADPKYGGIIEPEDIALMSRAWEDQILWLRHHPSILVWGMGSDKLPHPEAEKKYAEILRKYDPSRPYLNSTGGVGSDQGVITEVELVSDISGSSGMKMLGPYAYTPPIYWYTDKNFGGAYGFNTETSPGANVPPLESIKRMIPPDHLWPVDEVWEYHCGKEDFHTLDRFLTAVEKRYGKPEGVEDFAFKAQVLNYELMRPMFEAFQVNKAKAMGVIQWMLNSAWPNMYWQLYDSYLMPNGAFYGARNACKPLHLAYNYGDNSIRLINDHFYPVREMNAHIRVLDIQSKVLLDETVSAACDAEDAVKIYDLKIPENISTAYFLDLRLYDDKDRETDRNFYWLSQKQDVLDYEYEFEDWPFYTPSKEYADYRALHKLKKVKPDVKYRLEKKNNGMHLLVELTNKDKELAFFTELSVLSGKDGLTYLPVFWDDNYVTLLPGESVKLKVTVPVNIKKEDKPVIKVSGWNVEEEYYNLY